MINMAKRTIFVLICPILCMFQGLALLSLALFQLLYWIIYGEFKFSYKEIEDLLEYTEEQFKNKVLGT